MEYPGISPVTSLKDLSMLKKQKIYIDVRDEALESVMRDVIKNTSLFRGFFPTYPLIPPFMTTHMTLSIQCFVRDERNIDM